MPKDTRDQEWTRCTLELDTPIDAGELGSLLVAIDLLHRLESIFQQDSWGQDDLVFLNRLAFGSEFPSPRKPLKLRGLPIRVVTVKTVNPIIIEVLLIASAAPSVILLLLTATKSLSEAAKNLSEAEKNNVESLRNRLDAIEEQLGVPQNPSVRSALQIAREQIVLDLAEVHPGLLKKLRRFLIGGD